MKIFAFIGLWLIAFVLLASVGYCQSGEELRKLREEITALKEGQVAIQKDLEVIKNILTRQPQPPAPFKEAIVNIDSGYAKGESAAKIVMIEFSEYQ